MPSVFYLVSSRCGRSNVARKKEIWFGDADCKSQQQEDKIYRRFAETIDTSEIVEADNHAEERIIFDSGYSSE